MDVDRLVEDTLRPLREKTETVSAEDFLAVWCALLSEVEVEIQAFEETQE